MEKHRKGNNGIAVRMRTAPYTTFILDYSYPGRLKEVKQQIVEMTLNGSGV